MNYLIYALCSSSPECKKLLVRFLKNGYLLKFHYELWFLIFGVDPHNFMDVFICAVARNLASQWKARACAISSLPIVFPPVILVRNSSQQIFLLSKCELKITGAYIINLGLGRSSRMNFAWNNEIRKSTNTLIVGLFPSFSCNFKYGISFPYRCSLITPWWLLGLRWSRLHGKGLCAIYLIWAINEQN